MKVFLKNGQKNQKQVRSIINLLQKELFSKIQIYIRELNQILVQTHSNSCCYETISESVDLINNTVNNIELVAFALIFNYFDKKILNSYSQEDKKTISSTLQTLRKTLPQNINNLKLVLKVEELSNSSIWG